MGIDLFRRASSEYKIFPHCFDHFPSSLHSRLYDKNVTCFQVNRIFALRSYNAVPLTEIAIFPFYILYVPFAWSADPGAHDFATVFACIGIEIDGVRIALQFLPFASVEYRQRMSISKDHYWLRHVGTELNG
jgi:hypothetical protein